MGENVFIDYVFIKKYIYLIIILGVIIVINSYYFQQENQYNLLFILALSIVSIIIIVFFFFTSLPLIITPNVIIIPRIYSGKFKLGIDIINKDEIHNIKYIKEKYPFIKITTEEKIILINENRLVSKKYKFVLDRNYHDLLK